MCGMRAGGPSLIANLVADVIQFRPRTYEARPFTVLASGLQFLISGTLDGFLDFAVVQGNGASLTYSITCDDARMIAASLISAAQDVQANCLFDRDSLLVKAARPATGNPAPG